MPAGGGNWTPAAAPTPTPPCPGCPTGGPPPRGGRYRIRRVSWWPQELPRPRELAAGLRSLQRQDWRVDIIVTHCLPTTIQQSFGADFYAPDRLTDYLDTVRRRCEFGRWYCGHYHHERVYAGRFQVLYQSVVPLL